MKELDVLLTRYVDERFCSCAPARTGGLRGAAGAQDPVIYAYCLGTRAARRAFAALIERITALPRAGSRGRRAAVRIRHCAQSHV